MSNSIPWKAIFAIGFLSGALVVGAVTVQFDPGEAGPVSDSVTFGAPDGMNATISGDTDMIMETDILFPDSSTVQFRTSDANVTFASNGPAWAEIHTNNITGTYTYVSNIDAQNDITINPEDKAPATVGKSIETFAWRSNIQADDGTIDFKYSGSSGESKVTVQGVSANTQLGAVDADTGTLLDVATSDGSGVITFTNLTNSQHDVELVTSTNGPSLSNPDPDGETFRTSNVDLSIDVDDPDFPSESLTLEWYVDGSLETTTTANSAGTHTASISASDGQHDWYVVATDSYGNSVTSSTASFTVNHYNPVVENVQPDGDLQNPPSEISADISDKDFGGDGDTLTVDFILDGSQIDSQTINSNGTVTTSIPSSGQTGGYHDVQIDVTDSYGQSTTGTSRYGVPDVLYIRNETNYGELVPANGELRFIASDQVYSRSTDDGTFNMTGLPVNEDFIVEIEPTKSNYTSRTIYIQSIYEQQTAYVLNQSAYNTIESRFILNDPTAEFGPESVLQIQKGINKSGNVVYESVKADRFGAEGVTATLHADQRYQLKIINENGNEQSVGVYRSDTSETVEVQPGTPTISLNFTDTGYAYNAVLDNRTLEYMYSDPDGLTDELTVWIHERGNPSNKLMPNQTAIGIGNFSAVETLSENESEKEWVVHFIADRDGETFDAQVIVGNQEDLTPPIDQGWQLIIGIGLLFLFAGAFSVLNAAIGAVIVSLVGGVLWYIGFLGGATTGAAVVIAIFISVISYMYKGAL